MPTMPSRAGAARLLLSATLLLAAPTSARSQDAVPSPWLDPARVLVVYNTNWADGDGDGVGDSTEVASYYALRRGVPAGNLLGLALTPTSYAYSSAQWGLFVTELRDPIAAWLATHGDQSVDTLLLCYGVPYQLSAGFWGTRSVDSSLAVLNDLGTATFPNYLSGKSVNPYAEGSPGILPDTGHFDHSQYQFNGTTMYLHARLDGLDAEHCKALIDRAIYGGAHITTDPTGYSGVGYVDSRFKVYSDGALQAGYPFNYGSYTKADKSMAYGKFFVQQSGFPMAWEPYETEIGETGAQFVDGSSAELGAQALFYGGWYNYAKYSYGWDWKAGSLACDLNSNSAQGLRNASTISFLCQAFQENLTAGSGVIAEPYLNGHAKPDVFLAYVLAGYPWAEASCVSDATVKWMALHIGDPLYVVDPSNALPDTTAPTPLVWLGADWASLELQLSDVPGSAPGGTEVFRCTAVASGAGPGNLTTSPLAQPDDRRLQTVAVPPSGASGLTFATATCLDPSGNQATTAPVHFVAGPPLPAIALVQSDDLAPGPTDPVLLRFAFGAAGGLSQTVTAASIQLTAPAYGLVTYPVESLFLSLATDLIATRSGDQLAFTVSFAPGLLKPGPLTVDVSLTASGQTSSASVTVTVPN